MCAAGEDYESVLRLVTFHVGDTYGSRQCFYIYIITDNTPEPVELFHLQAHAADVQVYVPVDREHTYIRITDGTL